MLEHRITSAEQIELLLLLARSPERTWSREEVARTLGSAMEPTSMRLFLLASAGFIRAGGTGSAPLYRYGPADAATGALVELVLALWTENPHVITDALSPPVGRVRAGH